MVMKSRRETPSQKPPDRLGVPKIVSIVFLDQVGKTFGQEIGEHCRFVGREINQR
jgi:hypothetical protein